MSFCIDLLLHMGPDFFNAEDRVRIAALAAVAATPELFGAFVFKGGLALQYAFGSPRRSSDLDFDAIENYGREVTEEASHTLVHVAHTLDRAVNAIAPRFDLGSIRVQRKHLSDEIPTVMTQLGYSEHAGARPPFGQWVEMQITLCEVVCETMIVEINGIPARVPVLEDIIAEKLKAMAQQVDRRKARSVDVFDIWYFTRQSDHRLDLGKLADFFQRKIADLQTEVQKEMFSDDLLRAFSGNDYAGIVERLEDRSNLPPFEEAFEAVVELANRLMIRC